LIPEEFGKLVKSARDSAVKTQRFDGEELARLNIVAYMTDSVARKSPP
jgi:hypothetical protein